MNVADVKAPDQWICVGCGDTMGYLIDNRHTTDLSEREVYTICYRCYVKRKRDELVARLAVVADQLRAIGYDVDAKVDGQEV